MIIIAFLLEIRAPRLANSGNAVQGEVLHCSRIPVSSALGVGRPSARVEFVFLRRGSNYQILERGHRIPLLIWNDLTRTGYSFIRVSGKNGKLVFTSLGSPRDIALDNISGLEECMRRGRGSISIGALGPAQLKISMGEEDRKLSTALAFFVANERSMCGFRSAEFTTDGGIVDRCTVRDMRTSAAAKCWWMGREPSKVFGTIDYDKLYGYPAKWVH